MTQPNATAEPTTHEASDGAEGQPKTPEQNASESEPTTTERMFPDFFVKDAEGNPQITTERQEITPAPAAEDSTEAPAPEAKNPAAKTPEAKQPEYLDLTQLSGKLAKVKVDGVEMDVPAEDLLKNYQLDRHLTQRGQSLAEKEKELKSYRDELKKVIEENAEAPRPAAGEAAKADPRIDSLLKKIDAVEQSIKPIVTKEQVDMGIEKLDRAVRDNLGYEDFKDKIPQLRDEISKNFKDPGKPTEEELAKFDTLDFWYHTYQTVKLREMRNAPPKLAAPASEPPKGPILQKKPVVKPVIVEESGGASADTQNQDSQWKVKYDSALETARKTGSDEAWQRVFRLKRERSES